MWFLFIFLVYGGLNSIYFKTNLICLSIYQEEKKVKTQLLFIPFKMIHLSFNEPFLPPLLLAEYYSSDIRNRGKNTNNNKNTESLKLEIGGFSLWT